MRYLFLLLITLLVASGCKYPFEFRPLEEIRGEVLEKDPSFADVLDQKQKHNEKIKALKTQLSSEKGRINSKIAALRQEFEATQAKINEEIRKIDAHLDVHRLNLKSQIEELVIELKLKESSLAATNKNIAKLQNLVESGEESENLAEEAPKWKEKIPALRTQAQELEGEVSSLRKQIRLNRLKLKLLQ